MRFSSHYTSHPGCYWKIFSKAVQCKPCTEIDADTVPVEDYLDDNGCVTGERSDTLVEEATTKAKVDAGRRHNGDKNKSVSRLILHPKFKNPIPRTERSLELKLARKVSKRSMRDLRGL